MFAKELLLFPQISSSIETWNLVPSRKPKNDSKGKWLKVQKTVLPYWWNSSFPCSLLWHRLVSLSCRQLLFTTVVIMFFFLHLPEYSLPVVKYCQFTNGIHFINCCIFLFPPDQCYYVLRHLNNGGFCVPGCCSEGSVMVTQVEN